jgi:phosphoglycolate phosphatase
MMPMRDLGLIFDLDGTLIDSAPDIHAIANRVLATEGLGPLSFDQVRSFIGNGVGVLIQRCLGALGYGDDPALHARISARFAEIYEDTHDLTRTYPGVIEALDLLAARYPLALCTNKPEAPTRAVLRHFGLLDLFPVIVGGDTLAERKPHPAPLLLAQSRLSARRHLFLGDSEVDAETAKRAGVPFLLYTEGYRKTAPQSLGATLIFDNWSSLPAKIAALPL